AASCVMFIRPVKDYFDITGRIPDAIIRTAEDHADELKKEAQREGVTTSSEPDYRAANMVALLDKRDVYDLIAGDLSQVFSAGDELAPKWATSQPKVEGAPAPAPVPGPAFNLTKFSTDYSPGNPDQGTDTSRAGGMEKATDEPDKIGAYPRIKC